MTNQVAERDSECFYVERGGCSHYFSMETNVNIYHLASLKQKRMEENRYIVFVHK